MLIKNNELKKNDIFAAKLVSGEEIVGRIVEIDHKTVKLTKPLAISLMAHPQHREPVVAPVPWTLATDDNDVLEINRDHFLFITKARAEILNSYMQATSSLQIPSKGSII
jgi:hypothetical protein